MVLYSIVCRLGLGLPVPIQPSLSYKMNKNIASEYWGFFGLFPEALLKTVMAMDRLVDLGFWCFLRYGTKHRINR
jgi:hypothetical protein